MNRLARTILSLLLLTATGFAQDKMEVKDADNNVLMKVEDEGTAGSISLFDLGSDPATVLNKLYNKGGLLYFSGAQIGGVSPWVLNGSDIFYNSGKVGIGLNNPSTALHVSGTVTATAFVGDGSGLTNLPPGDGWSLTGNGGTVDGTNFIGTTDNVALDFRVNNVRGLRLEYADDGSNPAPNIIGGYSGNNVGAGVFGATIGGGGITGNVNSVTSGFGTVSGGFNNTVSGDFGSVGGGLKNTASGKNSTVVGGELNEAAGNYSFAAGQLAKANHNGTFVWADNSLTDFASTATQQFLIRAGNGVGINKNNPATALDVAGTVTATAFVGDGSGLTGLSGDDLGNHTATQSFNLANNDLTNGGIITATAFVGDGSGLTGLPSSPWSLNGAKVYYNSGNVGVGTNNPSHFFNVVGNGNALLSSSLVDVSELSAVFRNSIGASGNGVGVGFANSTAGSNVGAAIIHETTGANTPGHLHFATKNSGVAGSDIPIRMTIQSDGDIGIGTTTPTSKLDVSGTVTATGFVGDGSGLTGVSGDDLGSHTATQTLDLANNDVSNGGTITATAFVGDGSGLTGISVPGDDLGNHTATQALDLNGNEIINSGNVGIGTSAPQEALHIIKSNARIRLQSQNNPAIQFNDASANKAVIGWHASENLFKLNAQGNLSASLGINIAPGGNVGIGTESPASRLDVNGTVTATAFVGDGSGLTGISGDNLGNHTATQALDLASNDITNGGTVTATAFVGDGSGLTGISGDDLGNHTATQTLNLNGNWLSGDGGSEGIFVDHGGNVGLGTTTPGEKLHVNNGNVKISQTASNAASLSLEGHTAAGNQRTWSISTQNHATLTDGSDLAFSREGGEKVRIDTDGNVGIGTASPTNKLSVSGAANFTGGVSIGTTDSNNRLVVKESVTGSNDFANNYVVRFANTNTNGSVEQGILDLQFDAELNGNPGNGNWIQFVEGNDLAGKIENNNNGNVQYQSGGSDYAEYLERLDHKEEIVAGDVVGIFGGKISKRTEGADWVMAISDQAIVLGNAVYDGTEENYEITSFIGQVPVYVRGAVNKGDYIVASGLNDGTAIAIAPQDLQPEQGRLIVGRAWEAKETDEVARVNTVVGLPEAASTTMALAKRVEVQQQKIESQQAEIDALRKQVAQMNVLQAKVAQIELALRKMNASGDNIQMTSTAAANSKLQASNNK